MKNDNFSLKGYSLPLSPNGKSSLVTSPPWYFGGDALEITFRTDVDVFQKYLPYPFELSHSPGLVAITMVDMTSLKMVEESYDNPERVQYKECLFKLHCKLNGKEGWYVPETWVNKDFSLLRGFVQGFGKKMGQISITKLHRLNPLLGGKKQGAKIKGICESYNGIHVELGLTLESLITEDWYKNNSMFVMRHFPNIEDSGLIPVIHEVSELVVTDAVKDEIWKCSGEVTIRRNDIEEITELQPLEIVSARCYSEGFKLIGGKILHKY